MARIETLSPHVANLIAAGEVVECPASVVKELVENAVDAGAKHVTVELQNGGVTFIRVTDDGSGMAPEDAETAFLRHATSKIRTAEDLSAIGTMGFRGEALAAISSVSRIDLLTRTPEATAGVSLHLEGGVVSERSEVGCPVGTTILVRDLFFNTPARMKFLKRDSVEGAAAAAAVQKQALAHPEVAIRMLRDGAELFSTSGDGDLHAAIYAIFGRQLALDMLPVSGAWAKVQLTGFATKPSATRGNRSYQQFYVNGRPVVSKLLTTAFEQAYENQLLSGRFPACVLHLTIPADMVDVNVHPAKTEVKFLTEHDVFDCVRYGVQAALNGAPAQTARPELTFSKAPVAPPDSAPMKKSDFYQSMTSEQYRAYAEVLRAVPKQPAPSSAPVSRPVPPIVAEQAFVPTPSGATPLRKAAPITPPAPAPAPSMPEELPIQTELPMPPAQTWQLIGEAMDTYLIVQEGDSLLFVDKHAAHERILFEKLRAEDAPIMPQMLLVPITAQLEREDAALLLQNSALLMSLGYEFEDFGDGALLIRQIPCEIDPTDAVSSLESFCTDLRTGRQADAQSLRDALLHTVACKAAIKAGQRSDRRELEALCAEVLSREDIRFCPHGRPVCISLTKAQLERQFKRS